MLIQLHLCSDYDSGPLGIRGRIAPAGKMVPGIGVGGGGIIEVDAT